ncbi:MAG: hypothetical protein JSR36_06065 [Proteobacteria bacterium]|nr:hypothetical protein [Pseudomonadota bacterium]
MRLEFVYGCGLLDRFDLKGATKFFQPRLQLNSSLPPSLWSGAPRAGSNQVSSHRMQAPGMIESRNNSHRKN